MFQKRHYFIINIVSCTIWLYKFPLYIIQHYWLPSQALALKVEFMLVLYCLFKYTHDFSLLWHCMPGCIACGKASFLLHSNCLSSSFIFLKLGNCSVSWRWPILLSRVSASLTFCSLLLYPQNVFIRVHLYESAHISTPFEWWSQMDMNFCCWHFWICDYYLIIF